MKGQKLFRVACSADKIELLSDLFWAFRTNARELSREFEFEITEVSFGAGDNLLDGYDIVAPESSVWLRLAEERAGRDLFLSESVFAMSPLVVALRPGAADQIIGSSLSWESIRGGNYRVGFPSLKNSTGLLAALAVAASDQIDGPQDLAINRAQQSVEHYSAEKDLLDALYGQTGLNGVVLQEHFITNAGADRQQSAVPYFPNDGLVWADHPIALVNAPGSENRSEVFDDFCAFLGSAAAQAIVLRQGFRPASASWLQALEEEGERINRAALTRGIVPPRSIAASKISGAVALGLIGAKKRANVLLVVDVSPSMSGDKLERVQQSLVNLIGSRIGDEDRIGLLSFSDSVVSLVSMEPISINRTALEERIMELRPLGLSTALLRVVDEAHELVMSQGSASEINAVVLLTDGQDNASPGLTPKKLADRLDKRNRGGNPVFVFSIGYGDDADMSLLQMVTETAKGQAYSADERDIQDVYNTISYLF